MPLHTGNPMLELSTAYVLSRLRACGEDQVIKSIAMNGYNRLKIRPGLIAKKLDANGEKSADQVTFDDLRGLLPLGAEIVNDVFSECQSQSILGAWIYSNSSSPYPSAIVRPWDRAAIGILSSNRKSSLEPFISWYLMKQRVCNSISGLRMAWLIANTLILDRHDSLSGATLRNIGKFLSALRADGGFHRLAKDYYGSLPGSHPFIKYSEGH